MARDYRIEVTGATVTAVGLLNVEKQIQREMFEASREAAALLEEEAALAAPHPRSGTEAQGAGIFSRVERTSRKLAGRAPGGGVLVQQEFTVEVGVRGDHLSAYAETGTGTKRLPEFGGPGPMYMIVAHDSASGGKLAFKSMGGVPKMRYGVPVGVYAAGQLVVVPLVWHPGRAPEPFMADVGRAASDEIEQLYSRHIDSAVRVF